MSILFLTLILNIENKSVYQTPLERLVHLVESDGRLTNNEPILGDWCEKRQRFLSRGPLQITRDCHTDANVSFPYEEVDSLENSLIVFRKYMKRYANKDRFMRLGINREPTAEDMLRIWVGGPKGFLKKSTDSYWKNSLRRFLMKLNVGQKVFCKSSNREATIVSINEEKITIKYETSGEITEVTQGQISQLLLGNNDQSDRTFLQEGQ